jgi:CBS domain containing-hemolysin-like protein
VSRFAGETADEEDREDAESQRKLVDPQAAEVDARTKPMPLQAQHGARLDSDS